MANVRRAAAWDDPLDGLTDQERTLLHLLSEGLTNRQIAARMFLAEKTVKNYVSVSAVYASKLERGVRPPRS